MYISNMSHIDNSYGSLSESFEVKGRQGLLFIHPEMYEATFGMAPSGRYYIYCFYPKKGTCVFMIEQNENLIWFARFCAPYISSEFIKWISSRIEDQSK